MGVRFTGNLFGYRVELSVRPLSLQTGDFQKKKAIWLFRLPAFAAGIRK
jgi:hypothetical protein